MLFYQCGREVILLIATNTDQLYMAYDSFKGIYTALTSHIQAISQIKDQLAATAGAGDICLSLQRSLNDIEIQTECCRKLGQSLDIICQSYLACENRILDWCEGSISHYDQPEAKFIDLSAASALLQEFSFSTDGGDLMWRQDVLK